MYKNENMAYQNLWDAAKTMLRGKFIAINAYIKKMQHPKLLIQPSTLRH